MNPYRQLLAGTVVILAGVASASGIPTQIALSGHFGRTDPVKPGGDWWGLFPEGEGFVLKPTRVRVETTLDRVPGGKPYVSETRIRVPEKVDFALLFRGMMAAALGSVEFVALAERRGPLKPGEKLELTWKGLAPKNALTFSIAGEPEEVEGEKGAWTETRDYRVQIARSGDTHTPQLLFSAPRLGELEAPQLRWAGDLDRDGKVDLICNFGRHHTETALALYLSSAAKPGELVGLVARWTADCGC